jgi:NADH-quinone oxidoreductase subunit I
MTVEFARGKTYVVDRGKPKLRAGQGMLAGLDVVIKHFVSAFAKKLETPAETSGVFTVQYPEERLELPEAFRNFPILLYDDATGQELCTSCFQCERICPPQVIHMTQATDSATGKAVPAVDEFIIEYDACMSCGLCAEVCPFDAIKMDHEFELSTSDHSSMTVNKAGLNRPISYYQALAPRFWDDVKDSALKKLQGNMKRRSGNIGIAPNYVGKAQKAAPTAAKPAAAAAAAPAAAARPAAPVAAVGKNMSEEKLARLQAIRAANVAKSGGAPAPAVAEPAPVAAESDNGAEEAAPVAAAPASTAPSGGASVALSTGLPFSDENILGGVPANTAMAEDKVERLKAIRSGNLAKRG